MLSGGLVVSLFDRFSKFSKTRSAVSVLSEARPGTAGDVSPCVWPLRSMRSNRVVLCL
ncbi:protein of unknown function [Pararobbsia alpina]